MRELATIENHSGVQKCQVCYKHLIRKRSHAKYCSPRCKQKAHRKRNGAKSSPVTVSALRGRNADIVASASKLYLKSGMVVADVTFGRGFFWKKVDTSKFDFLPSDLQTGTDFRDLPYPDDYIDALILDPPYLASPTSGSALNGYNNSWNTKDSFEAMGISGMADVLDLYRQGMTEAHRVVRPGGQVWVKCQDSIESGKQWWNHITLYNFAQDLGWYPKDLLVLLSNTPTPQRWPYQQHAKKNHSYLWIFEDLWEPIVEQPSVLT